MIEDKSKLQVKFEKEFGEEQARRVIDAAKGHVLEGWFSRENGWDYGNDPFGNCLLLAISFQCIEISSYREYHGINISWEKFKRFCKKNQSLISLIDGDFDHIALLGSTYDFLNL